MSQRSEAIQTDDTRAAHGADAMLAKATRRTRRAAAPKASLIANRLRVPKSQGWVGRMAKQFQTTVVIEIEQERQLTAYDWACVDAIYFAVSGLALGYGFLGRKGWIDEREGTFHPVVETCLKLQRVVSDNFAKLGLDKRQAKTVTFLDQPIATENAPDADQCVSSVGEVSVGPFRQTMHTR